MQPLLEIRSLSKSFGHRIALQDVNFKIATGQVVGLTARTGFSKSSLMDILSGSVAPDSGMILFENKQLQWPYRSEDLGMSILFEEPELVDSLSVTENIFLGYEHANLKNWLGMPNQRKMTEEANRILSMLDVHSLSLQEEVSNLSSEYRYLITLAQVIARAPKLIVIDYPERLLGYPYQNKVLQLIRYWQRNGHTILFASSNLDHLFDVSDQICVLRGGRIVSKRKTDETSKEQVVADMVSSTRQQQHTPVIWALDSYYQARKQAEMLRHNQMLLKRDLAVSDNLNRSLVNQLTEQLSALDNANLALQDAQRRLLTEREEERKRLARELHDQIIQDLLALNYRMEDLGDGKRSMQAMSAEVHDLRAYIREMVDDLRNICGNLRPPTIDSLGLVAAIQSLLHEWRSLTNIDVDLDAPTTLGRLPEEIELSIFRIVQEALNNVWKHAQATQVMISLEEQSSRMILLTIADNGIGLDTSFDLAEVSHAGHYGLLGISERVALLGGRLSFQNQGEGGLLIRAEIPHPRTVQPSDIVYPPTG